MIKQTDRWVLIVACGVAALLATLSVMRYTGYNAGMLDIGNMSQAIWSVTRGRPLEFTYVSGNFSRLGHHVELIYAFLAPLYALWPSPITLLVFQTLLFVAGVFPLYQLALRKLEQTSAARMVALIYLMYPVAQTAVLFDFHGDTLAMPLAMFALEALDRKAWHSYSLWLFLSLSCKIYVAVAIVALGVTLWLKRQRQVGMGTALAGLAWGGIGYLVVRPIFAPPIANEFTMTLGSYLQFYFGDMGQDILTTAIPRLTVALVIFAPMIIPGIFAPYWLLPALAIAVPALLSTGLGPSFHYKHHHYALFVPFALAAIVYGAQALHQGRGGPLAKMLRQHQLSPVIGGLSVGLAVTLLLNSALVNTPLNPKFWNGKLGESFDVITYQRTSRDALKDRWLRQNVPADAPIAASAYLAPHLVNRLTLYRTTDLPGCFDAITYAIPDALFDFVVPLAGATFDGGPFYEAPAVRHLLQNPDFGLIAARDGLLLFQRNAPVEQTLLQRVEVHDTPTPETVIAHFGDKIGLTHVEVERIEGRLFRLRYQWVALTPLPATAPYFAVSHLAGVPDARIIHLPTYALYPTSEWQVGQEIYEEFDIRIPDETPAGTYPLWTNWYDSANIAAFATDARSQVGRELQVALLTVP